MILNVAPGFSATRGSNFKLAKQTCSNDFRKYFYCNRIVDAWNSLPNAVFAASSAENFKMNLCKVNFDRFFNYSRMILLFLCLVFSALYCILYVF